MSGEGERARRAGRARAAASGRAELPRAHGRGPCCVGSAAGGARQAQVCVWGFFSRGASALQGAQDSR